MSIRPTHTILTLVCLCLLVSQVSAQNTSFPTVNHNSGLVIVRGKSAQIGPENLNAGEPSDLLNRVNYTLVAAPKYGTLERSGTILGEWESFTQADINAGNVIYHPNQTNNSNDSFDFRLTYGPLFQRISLLHNGPPVQTVLQCANNLSANGRFVFFYALDDNVVEGDSNGKWDIFLQDLDTGNVELISRGYNNCQSNGDSVTEEGYLSSGGRYVAFDSSATNLIAPSTVPPNQYHVYRYDTLLEKMMKVDPYPISPSYLANSYVRGISSDGQLVLYSVDGNIFNGRVGSSLNIYDFEKDTHEVITSLAGFSHLWGVMSSDGRFILASNEILYDRWTNTEEPVRMNNLDVPSISDDGGYIVFVGGDGILPGDDNGAADLFVYDRVLKKYEQLTFTSEHAPETGNKNGVSPSISGDGRFIAYAAPKKIDQAIKLQIMLYDRETRETRLVSNSSFDQPGNNHSLCPSLSTDGSRLSFYSQATNLIQDGSMEDAIYVRQFPNDIYKFSITFDNSWPLFMPLISH